MDFNTGNIDYNFENDCKENCMISISLLAQGDSVNKSLIMNHLVAEKSRSKYLNSTKVQSRGLFEFIKESINSLFSF